MQVTTKSKKHEEEEAKHICASERLQFYKYEGDANDALTTVTARKWNEILEREQTGEIFASFA